MKAVYYQINFKLFWSFFGTVQFLGGVVFAQSVYEKCYQNLSREEIPAYITQDSTIKLRMDYGHYDILNDKILEEIEGKEIERINLIYTDHPKGISFKKLNTNRLRQLYERYPLLFSDTSVSWSIYMQTNCPSKEIAVSYFHGFELWLKPDDKLPKEIPTAQIPETPKTSLESASPQLVKQEPQEINLLLTPLQKTLKRLPRPDWRYLAVGADSITTQVFERNKDRWKDIITVSDWTASMYPYTTQVLRWHLERQSESNIRHFVFFNDGDKKRNNEKKKGEIGGIYKIEADSVLQVIRMMKFVRAQGDGGDLEENDIEALVYAMDNFPEAEEFALIADNKSEVRDMSLIRKLDRPVRVILGRLPERDYAFLNTQYIELAERTKGSVHTFDRDFYTRKELNELRRLVKARKQEIKDDQRKFDSEIGF